MTNSCIGQGESTLVHRAQTPRHRPCPRCTARPRPTAGPISPGSCAGSQEGQLRAIEHAFPLPCMDQNPRQFRWRRRSVSRQRSLLITSNISTLSLFYPSLYFFLALVLIWRSWRSPTRAGMILTPSSDGITSPLANSTLAKSGGLGHDSDSVETLGTRSNPHGSWRLRCFVRGVLRHRPPHPLLLPFQVAIADPPLVPMATTAPPLVPMAAAAPPLVFFASGI